MSYLHLFAAQSRVRRPSYALPFDLPFEVESMMNNDSLAKGITATGAIVVMIALLWWHSFFRSLAQQYDPGLGEHDPTLDRALICIAYSTAACKEASNMAREQGRTPYSPWLFWMGVTITVAGLSQAELKRSDGRK